MKEYLEALETGRRIERLQKENALLLAKAQQKIKFLQEIRLVADQLNPLTSK